MSSLLPYYTTRARRPDQQRGQSTPIFPLPFGMCALAGYTASPDRVIRTPVHVQSLASRACRHEAYAGSVHCGQCAAPHRRKPTIIRCGSSPFVPQGRKPPTANCWTHFSVEQDLVQVHTNGCTISSLGPQPRAAVPHVLGWHRLPACGVRLAQARCLCHHMQPRHFCTLSCVAVYLGDSMFEPRFPRAPFGRPFGFAQGRLWAIPFRPCRAKTPAAARPGSRQAKKGLTGSALRVRRRLRNRPFPAFCKHIVVEVAR